jgi:hypothetical protein
MCRQAVETSLLHMICDQGACWGVDASNTNDIVLEPRVHECHLSSC